MLSLVQFISVTYKQNLKLITMFHVFSDKKNSKEKTFNLVKISE